MDVASKEESFGRNHVILGSLILGVIGFSVLWFLGPFRGKKLVWYTRWKLLAAMLVPLGLATAILVLDIISWRKGAGKEHPNSAQDTSSAKDTSSAQQPRSAQHLQCFLQAFGPLFDVCTTLF
jgi:hypothetical protein